MKPFFNWIAMSRSPLSWRQTGIWNEAPNCAWRKAMVVRSCRALPGLARSYFIRSRSPEAPFSQ
ncbi:hypothetical protein DPM13_05815 [Paracoccus mutanolyticus]|uniref:Uncharacterized protein n=1 Tax=Paracoccus mutanolyticus TaxID=1499308 RepID=A0ABN5M7D4_9RHOB|nr:hypothetical protein DPM13_05815 [Paracoccus mutanolyticus]